MSVVSATVRGIGLAIAVAMAVAVKPASAQPCEGCGVVFFDNTPLYAFCTPEGSSLSDCVAMPQIPACQGQPCGFALAPVIDRLANEPGGVLALQELFSDHPYAGGFTADGEAVIVRGCSREDVVRVVPIAAIAHEPPSPLNERSAVSSP